MLNSTSPIARIRPEQAEGRNTVSAYSAIHISIINSFNNTKSRTSDSHNNSSHRVRGSFQSSGRRTPPSRLSTEGRRYPPWGASGGISHLTQPISPQTWPSSLPQASRHLIQALRAELASVFRLLEIQAEGSLSTRDMNDILRLITISSDLRVRLEKLCPNLAELAPDPHPLSSDEAYPPSFYNPAPIIADRPTTTTVHHYPPSGQRDLHPPSSDEAHLPSFYNPALIGVHCPTTTVPHYPPPPASSHEAHSPFCYKPTPISVGCPTPTVPHYSPSVLPGCHHHSRRDMVGPYPIHSTHAPDPQIRAGEPKMPFWRVSFRLTRRMGYMKGTNAV